MDLEEALRAVPLAHWQALTEVLTAYLTDLGTDEIQAIVNGWDRDLAEGVAIAAIGTLVAFTDSAEVAEVLAKVVLQVEQAQ